MIEALTLAFRTKLFVAVSPHIEAMKSIGVTSDGSLMSFADLSGCKPVLSKLTSALTPFATLCPASECKQVAQALASLKDKGAAWPPEVLEEIERGQVSGCNGNRPSLSVCLWRSIVRPTDRPVGRS